MAVSNGHLFPPITFEAGADLSAAQFKFVKFNGSVGPTGQPQVVVCAAATDTPIGILQNKPAAAGRAAEVIVAGMSKVQADASLTVGTKIGTSGDAQADAKTPGTDTTEYVVGVVFVAAGNAGELATVLVNCLSPTRAA